MRLFRAFGTRLIDSEARPPCFNGLSGTHFNFVDKGYRQPPPLPQHTHPCIANNRGAEGERCAR